VHTCHFSEVSAWHHSPGQSLAPSLPGQMGLRDMMCVFLPKMFCEEDGKGGEEGIDQVASVSRMGTACKALTCRGRSMSAE